MNEKRMNSWTMEMYMTTIEPSTQNRIFLIYVLIDKKACRDGSMAKVIFAVSKDACLVPSIHLMIHNHL